VSNINVATAPPVFLAVVGLVDCSELLVSNLGHPNDYADFIVHNSDSTFIEPIGGLNAVVSSHNVSDMLLHMTAIFLCF